ncbi:MAG: hypothetical protein ACLPN5_03710 [Roseiarcus sp.]
MTRGTNTEDSRAWRIKVVKALLYIGASCNQIFNPKAKLVSDLKLTPEDFDKLSTKLQTKIDPTAVKTVGDLTALCA